MNFDGLTPAQRAWKETTTETVSQTVTQTLEAFFLKTPVQSIPISTSFSREVYVWLLNNACRLREIDRPVLTKISQAFKTVLNREWHQEKWIENFAQILHHAGNNTFREYTHFLARTNPTETIEHFDDLLLEDDEEKVAIVKIVGSTDPLLAIQSIQTFKITDSLERRKLAVFLFQQDKILATFRIQKYFHLFNLPESERLNFAIEYLKTERNGTALLKNVNTPKDVLKLNEESLYILIKELSATHPHKLVENHQLFKPTVARIKSDHPVYEVGQKECFQTETRPAQITLKNEHWLTIMRNVLIQSKSVVGCLQLNSEITLMLIAEYKFADELDAENQVMVIKKADYTHLIEHFKKHGLKKFNSNQRLMLSKVFIDRSPEVAAKYFSNFESAHYTELAETILDRLWLIWDLDFKVNNDIVFDLIKHLNGVNQYVFVKLVLVISTTPEALKKWFENAPFTTWKHEVKLEFIQELVNRDPAKGIIAARYCKDVTWNEVLEMAPKNIKNDLKKLSKFLDERSTYLERINREEFSEKYPELSKKLDRYERSLEMMRALHKKRYQVLSPLLKQAVASPDYPELVITTCLYHPRLIAYMMHNAPVKTLAALDSYFPMNLYINNPDGFVNILIEIQENRTEGIRKIATSHEAESDFETTFLPEEISKIDQLGFKDFALAFFQRVQNVVIPEVSKDAKELLTDELMERIKSLGNEVYERAYSYLYSSYGKKRPPTRVLELFSEDLLNIISEISGYRPDIFHPGDTCLFTSVKITDTLQGHEVLREIKPETIDALILKLGFQEFALNFHYKQGENHFGILDLLSVYIGELASSLDDFSGLHFCFSLMDNDLLQKQLPILNFRLFESMLNRLPGPTKSHYIFFRYVEWKPREFSIDAPMHLFGSFDLSEIDFTSYADNYPEEFTRLNNLKKIYTCIKELSEDKLCLLPNKIEELASEPELFIDFLSYVTSINYKIACLMVSQFSHLIQGLLPDLSTRPKNQVEQIKPFLSHEDSKKLLNTDVYSNACGTRQLVERIEVLIHRDDLYRVSTIPFIDKLDLSNYLEIVRQFSFFEIIFYATEEQRLECLNRIKTHKLMSKFDPDFPKGIKSLTIYKRFTESLENWDSSQVQKPLELLQEFDQLIHLLNTYLIISKAIQDKRSLELKGLFEILEKSSPCFPEALGVILEGFIDLLEKTSEEKFCELESYLYENHTKLKKWASQTGQGYLGLAPPELIQRTVYEIPLEERKSFSRSRVYDLSGTLRDYAYAYSIGENSVRFPVFINDTQSSALNAVIIPLLSHSIVNLIPQKKQRYFTKLQMAFVINSLLKNGETPQELENPPAVQAQRWNDIVATGQFLKPLAKNDNGEGLIEKLESAKNSPSDLIRFLELLPHMHKPHSYSVFKKCQALVNNLIPSFESSSLEIRTALLPYLPHDWIKRTLEEEKQLWSNSLGFDETSLAEDWVNRFELAWISDHLLSTHYLQKNDNRFPLYLAALFPFLPTIQQIIFLRFIDSEHIAQEYRTHVFDKVKKLIEQESYEEFVVPNLRAVMDTFFILFPQLHKNKDKDLLETVNILNEYLNHFYNIIIAEEKLKNRNFERLNSFIENEILQSKKFIPCLRFMIQHFPELTAYFVKDRSHIVLEKLKVLFPNLDQIDLHSRAGLLPLLPPDLVCITVLEVSNEEKKQYLSVPFKFDDYDSSTLGVLRDVARNHIKDEASIPPITYRTFQNLLNAIPVFTLAYMACDETNQETTLLWLPLMNNSQCAAVIPSIAPKIFVDFVNGKGKSMRDFYLAFATNAQKEAYLKQFTLNIEFPEPSPYKTMEYTLLLRQYERLNSVLLSHDPSESLKLTIKEKIFSKLTEIKTFLDECRKKLPEEDSIPDEFVCPITREVMEIPCSDSGATGMRFDRSAFITHWNTHKTHPITHEKFDIEKLVDDISLKEKIAEWITQKNSQLKTDYP